MAYHLLFQSLGSLPILDFGIASTDLDSRTVAEVEIVNNDVLTVVIQQVWHIYVHGASAAPYDTEFLQCVRGTFLHFTLAS